MSGSISFAFTCAQQYARYEILSASRFLVAKGKTTIEIFREPQGQTVDSARYHPWKNLRLAIKNKDEENWPLGFVSCKTMPDPIELGERTWSVCSSKTEYTSWCLGKKSESNGPPKNS